ncbi:hypothetical protein D9M71_592710 [compost metagenome]
MAGIDIHISLEIVVDHVGDRSRRKQMPSQSVRYYDPEITVLKMFDPVIHYQIGACCGLPVRVSEIAHGAPRLARLESFPAEGPALDGPGKVIEIRIRVALV